MRIHHALLLTFCLFAGPLFAEEAKPDLVWHRDFASAKKDSAEKKRPLFVEFTGSDWCVNCKIFAKKIEASEAFITYAGKHLVLFKADFPMNTKQSAEIDAQNEKLGKEFGISIFPAFYLVDSEGKIIAEIPYDPEMPPEQFLQGIKEATNQDSEKP